MQSVSLVRPPFARPSGFALRGPRGLVVTVERRRRGLYAVRHPQHGRRIGAVRGSQARALAVASRYARRYA